MSFGLTKANIKLKSNTSFDETEKPTQARKAKEGPAKMNIDSIMEEENLEKAKSLPNKFLEDRRKQVERALSNIAIPKPISPQVIEKPLSQIDSITATGELKSDRVQVELGLDLFCSITGVDTFGFATASRPLVQEKAAKTQKSPSRRDSRRSRSRERKRRRRRSRTRSRSSDARKPKVDTRGLKVMPNNWPDCKAASLSILEPEFFRIQRELLDPEIRKKLRTQKLGKKIFVQPAEEVVEGFSRDCEWALRGTQGKLDTSEVEFPKAGVKECKFKGPGKDDPVITWSQNPKWDPIVKTREEVLAEASETEAAVLAEFWNQTTLSEGSKFGDGDDPKEPRKWFPRERFFLDVGSSDKVEFNKFLECFEVGTFPVKEKEKEKTKKKRSRKEMEQELEELEKIMEAKEEELDLSRKKKKKKKKKKGETEFSENLEPKSDQVGEESSTSVPKKKKKKQKNRENEEFEDFTSDESETEMKVMKKKKKKKKSSSKKSSDEERDSKPCLSSPAKPAQDNLFANRLMSMAGYLGDSGNESRNESLDKKSNSSRISETKSRRRHPSERSPVPSIADRSKSPILEEPPTDPRLRKRKSGPRTPSPAPQTETHSDHRRSSNERPRSPNSCISNSDLRKRRHARTPPLPPSSDRSPSPSPPPLRRRPLSPDCISETSLRSPIHYSMERELPPEEPRRGRASPPPGSHYGRRGYSPRGRGSSPPPRRPPSPVRRPPSPMEHDRWRPPSPGAGRRDSYRYRDASPPRRYGRGESPSPTPRGRYSRSPRSPSPRRRRSPGGGYNGRAYSPDRRRAVRSPSPRFYHHRGRGDSPYRSPRDEYHYRRTSDGYYRPERSMPDSTISDADLLASHRSAPLLALPGNSDLQIDSPKRPSLDERLEKELGISVRKDPIPPIDYTKPPPGYAPVDGRVATGGSAQYHATKHPHLPPPNPLTRTIPAYPHQQVQPQPVSSGPTLSVLPTATLLPAKMPSIKSSHFEGPVVDDNRLVRVGNMVQIVPEEKKQQQEQNTVIPPPTSSGEYSVKADANPALNMNKKIEEMTKRKEAERRMRREQRAAERLQQQRDSNVVPETVVEPEVKKSSGKRILETLEKEEDQEAKEAQLLKEAISTVPDLEEEDGKSLQYPT